MNKTPQRDDDDDGDDDDGADEQYDDNDDDNKGNYLLPLLNASKRYNTMKELGKKLIAWNVITVHRRI